MFSSCRDSREWRAPGGADRARDTGGLRERVATERGGAARFAAAGGGAVRAVPRALRVPVPRARPGKRVRARGLPRRTRAHEPRTLPPRRA